MDINDEVTRIEDFIKHHVQISCTNGVVIGISGGLDSAVVATLAFRALGKDKVHGIFMPSCNTPEEDYGDVGALMGSIGADALDVQDIDDIVTLFNVADVKARGNVMARVRMTMLYAEANAGDCLVLGTSDKSELTLGYFTKWGDGAGDIMPIAHLYKTEVRQLARVLKIPENIVKKPSSPALVRGIDAEVEIGFGYDEIDRMLKGELPIHSRIEEMMELATHKLKIPPRLS